MTKKANCLARVIYPDLKHLQALVWFEPFGMIPFKRFDLRESRFNLAPIKAGEFLFDPPIGHATPVVIADLTNDSPPHMPIVFRRSALVQLSDIYEKTYNPWFYPAQPLVNVSSNFSAPAASCLNGDF